MSNIVDVDLCHSRDRPVRLHALPKKEVAHSSLLPLPP